MCRRALPELIPDQDQYCFGKTKVFFRAGQVALLERLRAERLRGAAVIIQSRVRGWLARVRFIRLQLAAVTIQKYCRGALARRWVEAACPVRGQGANSTRLDLELSHMEKIHMNTSVFIYARQMHQLNTVPYFCDHKAHLKVFNFQNRCNVVKPQKMQRTYFLIHF